jgi:hypothetical protein
VDPLPESPQERIALALQAIRDEGVGFVEIFPAGKENSAEAHKPIVIVDMTDDASIVSQRTKAMGWYLFRALRALDRHGLSDFRVDGFLKSEPVPRDPVPLALYPRCARHETARRRRHRKLCVSLGVILAWFDIHAPALQIFLAIVAGGWALYRFRKYLNEKTLELQDQRFKSYHDLIKIFVEPEQNRVYPKIDRQIAVVYEFRNFPEYFPLTFRILESWYSKKDSEPAKDTQRLYKEIELTLQYIKDKQAC